MGNVPKISLTLQKLNNSASDYHILCKNRKPNPLATINNILFGLYQYAKCNEVVPNFMDTKNPWEQWWPWLCGQRWASHSLFNEWMKMKTLHLFTVLFLFFFYLFEVLSFVLFNTTHWKSLWPYLEICSTYYIVHLHVASVDLRSPSWSISTSNSSFPNKEFPSWKIPLMWRWLKLHQISVGIFLWKVPLESPFTFYIYLYINLPKCNQVQCTCTWQMSILSPGMNATICIVMINSKHTHLHRSRFLEVECASCCLAKFLV